MKSNFSRKKKTLVRRAIGFTFSQISFCMSSWRSAKFSDLSLWWYALSVKVYEENLTSHEVEKERSVLIIVKIAIFFHIHRNSTTTCFFKGYLLHGKSESLLTNFTLYMDEIMWTEKANNLSITGKIHVTLHVLWKGLGTFGLPRSHVANLCFKDTNHPLMYNWWCEGDTMWN